MALRRALLPVLLGTTLALAQEPAEPAPAPAFQRQTLNPFLTPLPGMTLKLPGAGRWMGPLPQGWLLGSEPARDPAAAMAARRLRRAPSAIVVVWDRMPGGEEERKERIEDFRLWAAPAFSQAFQLGLSSPYTGQMLGEFMTMTAHTLRPPTVPDVFYNGFLAASENPVQNVLDRAGSQQGLMGGGRR